MHLTPSALLRTILVAGGALLMGGCVTAKKYRLAKPDVPPAKILNWNTTTPAAEITVASVIIFKGPGSWKREARWDEYVVAFTNPGAELLVVHSAELLDLRGAWQLPGAEPWALEKLSYNNWDKYGKTGLKVLAGAGAVTLYAGALSFATMGPILAFGPATATAASGGAVAVLAVIPVVAIVDVAVVASLNRRNKKAVVAEFNRRRLVLPLELAPGETRGGSFFFPMTPGPQQLLVRGEAGGKPIELIVALAPLADLHLKKSR